MDPQTTVVEENTRQSDVAAAFDTHTPTDTPAVTPTEKPTPAAVEKPVPADKAARSVEKPAPAEKPTAVVETDEPSDTTDELEAMPKEEPSHHRPKSTERAPISWKPSMREHWGALPEEVRTEIYRRERDISKGLGEAAEARKFHQSFNDIAKPYEHLIAMEAKTPLEGFQNYLRTAAVLRQGTNWEKATSLAQVIKQFQIDPTLLDQALVGAMPPQGSQQQQYRDPRLDELLGTLAEQQKYQQQQVEDEAMTELEQFRSTEPEFLPDVEDYMADILSSAASKGHIISLQQAYDRAIMVHPEISEIVMKRRQSTGLQQSAQVVEAARRKATGGGNAPKVGGKPPVGDSIRSAIESSIDRLSGM